MVSTNLTPERLEMMSHVTYRDKLSFLHDWIPRSRQFTFPEMSLVHNLYRMSNSCNNHYLLNLQKHFVLCFQYHHWTKQLVRKNALLIFIYE